MRPAQSANISDTSVQVVCGDFLQNRLVSNDQLSSNIICMHTVCPDATCVDVRVIDVQVADAFIENEFHLTFAIFSTIVPVENLLDAVSSSRQLVVRICQTRRIINPASCRRRICTVGVQSSTYLRNIQLILQSLLGSHRTIHLINDVLLERVAQRNVGCNTRGLFGIDVQLQLRISGITVQLVLINISLNSSISRVAVSFILVNVRLNRCVSRVAVSFILVNVRLNRCVCRVAVSFILVNVRLDRIDVALKRNVCRLQICDIAIIGRDLSLKIGISSIAVQLILVNVSLNRCVSRITIRFVLVNVGLNGSISRIAVSFVLVNVSLNRCVSRVAVSFILVNVSLNRCVSRVAVSLILINVSLNRCVSRVAVSFILINISLNSVDICLQNVVGSDACSFFRVNVVLQSVSNERHLAISWQVCAHCGFVRSHISIDGQIAVDDSVVVQSRLPSDCERTIKINCPRNRKVSFNIQIIPHSQILRAQLIRERSVHTVQVGFNRQVLNVSIINIEVRSVNFIEAGRTYVVQIRLIHVDVRVHAIVEGHS